ncbi:MULTISPECIES: ATP-dependent DNA ligase [unclassified Streptomyces]|uniref:ATP-dependent DNA ligase n=1 Tax=unclassified Streptomyces TaxID=2593676 RepID=UPI001BE7016C|nr:MULTISPECIES: ATP-dependent DNA ligase [unclassified Streptomyces]MBT2405133.1 ATP-dependent DNA ligase [Streptomyces sp. ISL-21]MBT2610901.1 ATP-dependent DNA ligase [Streptomyces sp. ISL-87]
MLLAEVARVSREVAETSARSRKTALLAELFAAAPADETGLVISYLAGRLPQGRPGIGWRALSRETAPAPTPTLTVSAVDAAVTELAAATGAGSQAERHRILDTLLGAATEPEQRFLRSLLSGEVRQGALDAVALEGVAAAAGVPAAELRRAVMLDGSLPRVAAAVLAEGARALSDVTLRVGQPVQPMLANTAKSVAAALAALGPCAVEEKLDGIRVQVHREGDDVRVYTRSLDEITHRLPEVAELARALPGDRFILDGEVIGKTVDGRPVPFQEVASRVGSRLDVAAARQTLAVAPYFFDALAADGRVLLDLPVRERYEVLASLVPDASRVRRLVVEDPATQTAQAEEFWAETLRRGHEGVMVKALASTYAAGRRGKHWLKVKPVHTLDLVVLAAEWGHGRRTGLLSNLHLGARAADGTYAMLGKTFKGLTDEMLRWQTERLRELAIEDDGFTVRVRPELVVEIAYDGLQRSPRYPAGVALRFARVLRHRPDKSAEQADTVETVLAGGAA